MKKQEKKLKVFLSYSSLDYEFAKEVKSFLEDFGLDVFLAHTSIEPTKEWEEEILKNLKKCDVFMPILTQAFKQSKWADQETGIAFNEGKKIFPITIDLVPYGFIGKFQALIFHNNITLKLSRLMEKLEIIKALMTHFPNKIRKSFFDSIDKTYSFREGTTKFRFLKMIEPFNKEEINKIMEESSKNNQIYEAHEVKYYLRELIKKYKKEINQSTKEKIIPILKN